MKVVFLNSTKSIVKNVESKDLWSKLSTVLVDSPKILDGLGERHVYKSGKLKSYSEIIFVKWIDGSGNEREECFQGHDSYFLQSVIEDLESIKA
jgi:hypothetical protein